MQIPLILLGFYITINANGGVFMEIERKFLLESIYKYPYNNLNVLSNYSVPAATLHNANIDGTKKMNIRINRIKKNLICR